MTQEGCTRSGRPRGSGGNGTFLVGSSAHEGDGERMGRPVIFSQFVCGQEGRTTFRSRLGRVAGPDPRTDSP